MSVNQKMHFKECPPHETVKKLKGILNEMGIETEEYGKLESKIGTHSLRVILKGTSFGANGKGVSEIFCAASAYAELFERFQNDIGLLYNLKKGSKYGFHFSFDEKILSAPEIISESNPFIEFYFKQRNMSESSFEEKVESFERTQRLDFWMYQLEDRYVTVPFYHVNSEKVVFLPYNTYISYYGSNGMCAGNTPEEALVQGLSEIFERVAQKRIFLEKPCLPDIPDEYIKKFPYVFELLEKLRENDGYVYRMKDCSFGGKYPVAGLLILEKNTGRFGIKLGCHPDYGIAMERAFTEATQGGDVFDYINRSVVDFHNRGVDDDTNITNSYKTGAAQYPYQILGDNFSYSFTAAKDVSEMTNKEILHNWISEIRAEGYDIFIRDVSFLGFPSFHIIIPGLSELQNADDLRFRAMNTKMFVQVLLSMTPDNINDENIRYISSTFNYFRNVLIENGISQYFLGAKNFEYPGIETDNDFRYMIAMCDVFSGNYQDAEVIIQTICKSSIERKIEKKKIDFYSAVYYYVSAMSELHDHGKAMEFIDFMFDKNVSEKIDYIFSDRKLVIERQYPCRENHLDEDDNPYNIGFMYHEKLLERQIKSGIEQKNVCSFIQ